MMYELVASVLFGFFLAYKTPNIVRLSSFPCFITSILSKAYSVLIEIFLLVLKLHFLLFSKTSVYCFKAKMIWLRQ